MADQVPTSRKIPPLAIIVVVILVALAVVAFANMRGKTLPPSGGEGAPQDRPVVDRPVMPQQSQVTNTPAPASTEKGAMGAQGDSDDKVNEVTADRVARPPR